MVIYRLYVDSVDVEVEWLVGPIPISDGIGKEIIAQYSTPVQSKGEFYTDSNGRQMLKRVRDYRPTWKLNVTEPVSGNYYPINSRMFIKDEHQQVDLFFMTLDDCFMQVAIKRRQRSMPLLDYKCRLLDIPPMDTLFLINLIESAWYTKLAEHVEHADLAEQAQQAGQI